jgi:hypothetical protein
MKSQSGVTLISLTIYLIVMSIVIAIISVVSTYFYKNIGLVSEDVEPLTEYTKLNSFLSDEVNHDNIKVLEYNSEIENSYIVFDNGVQYTFIKENNAVYRNKVKICKGVKTCKFDYEIKSGKRRVIVNIEMESGNIKRDTNYILRD